MDKLIIKPKKSKVSANAVTITIRIPRTLQEKLDELSEKTNYSRSELISITLEYALNNMKIQVDE